MFVILVIFSSLVGPFFSVFFFFIFCKAYPFASARQNTSKNLRFLYLKYFASKTTFFSDDIRVLLLFSSSPFCRCFLVLSSSGLDVLHLGCVWAVILEDSSFSFYAMQSPFLFFSRCVCDKHNVPQIMVVLGCLFARKPMARAGCKYPLPASRKSIPNTDTFSARPYIRPDNTHISFLTKFLGQA